MFEMNACRETVSIIEALIFGANGACIDLGLPSLLGGIALFIGAVVVLRVIGSAVLRRILPSRAKPREPAPSPEDTGLKPLPYENPIESTGAWGGKPR